MDSSAPIREFDGSIKMQEMKIQNKKYQETCESRKMQE